MSETMTNARSNDADEDPGLHFLELARDMEVEDGEELAPTELNTINSSGGFLVMSTDKLSVKYTGGNLHGHDVGVVQANRPAPVKRLLYYFEIYVKDAGTSGQIAIGFTLNSFKMRRQPGWEANSCGYHGDDGMLYRGQGRGDAFGPTFTSGDTVGGGINYASQEYFFTKNGLLVGTVGKNKKGPLFPTIAVHSQNEEVHVNFGKKPFAFDIQEFEVQERMKQQMEILKESLPPNVSYELVRSYLLHQGYKDTLKSFDIASSSILPPVTLGNGFDDQNMDNKYALSQRNTLCQLIGNGEIDAAFSKLQEWYPQIIQDEKSETCFLLHCQKFIELVRFGALEDALKYGRLELVKYFKLAGFEDLVQACVTLLAYVQPLESPVGYLLKGLQREVVAAAVNARILSISPNSRDSCQFSYSPLERLLRQLAVCYLEKRSLNGDQGEVFNLHRFLNSGK